MLEDCHLGVAGNAARVPAGQVHDWLGVHVGLLVGGVDTPHVHHVGDLAQPQREGLAAHHVAHSAALRARGGNPSWNLGCNR